MFRILNHYQRPKIQIVFFQTILTIVFWKFTVFQYGFDSLQKQRDLASLIINYIHTSCFTSFPVTENLLPRETETYFRNL